MPLTSIEDASNLEQEEVLNNTSEAVSQQGTTISKFRDNDLDYTSMFSLSNNQADEPISGRSERVSYRQEDFANDPYQDDDVLQERLDNKFRSHVPPSVRGESIRRSYEYGSYTGLSRMQQDNYPYPERENFNNFPSHVSNDYGYSMGERHTPSMHLGGSYNPNAVQGNDAYEDGLFIETMPSISSEGYNYRENSLISPRPRSPTPFERQRRHNSCYHDDDLTPDLHPSYTNHSYSSLSFFRDGGVGVGRNFQQNPLNDDYWMRTQSVSSNMNSLGSGFSNPYSRASYSSLRSSTLSHSRPQLGELGPSDYDTYRGDMYSGQIAPHRVSSMERIPDYYRGYHNHHDSFRDRESDIPMSRARSMMYLGEDNGMDSYYSMKTVSRENSYQNFGGLDSATLLETESRGVMIPNKRVSPSVLLESENTTPITDSPVEKASPAPVEKPVSKTASVKQEESKSPSPQSKPEQRSLSPEKPQAEWRQRNSPSPTPGKPRSPRPADEDKKHNKYKFPCRDFENGVCSRGAACKFYHDPSKAVTSPDKIPICRDFSKGKCSRDNCRFRHPGTHKDNVLMGIEQPSTPTELDEIYKQFSSTLKPRNH